MNRQDRSVPRHHSSSRSMPLWLLLFLLSLTPCLAACGGGSGSTPGAGIDTPTVPSDPGTNARLIQLVPATLQANFNEPIELTGRGLVPPVEIRFRDAQGKLLGSPVEAEVLDGGRRLRGRSPMLPQVSDSQACEVEVVNGDGEVLDLDQDVEFVCPVAQARAITGFGNNTLDASIGGAGTALRNDVPYAYADGISEPSGANRPSPRAVSSLVCAQAESIPTASGATDMFWLWGQFVDHDIDLTGEADPVEEFSIAVPIGDEFFDPFDTGIATIGLNRSTWLPGTGTDVSNPRRQPNQITSWIDGSNVYGSDAVRANALRTLDGTGRLKTSDGNLLPFNTDALPNAPSAAAPDYFLAGDIRANEQVGLTALHTLFMREHNRLADEFRADNPHLSGEEIYQAARRWVGAELQVITYQEFLPLLLGNGALNPYAGYDASVDGAIGILFSGAAYRFGHSMVSGTILRLDADGETIAEGDLSLRDAFFNPSLLPDEGGLEPVLRGFAAQVAQELDPLIVDDLRNFLFGPPGAGGLDLAALNMQRGRDHGLPGYNASRAALGLSSKDLMDDITGDESTVSNLVAAYTDTSDIDVWVGALCEERLQGALVGELLHQVFSDQFSRLRDGDRFFYKNVFAGEALRVLEQTRLADVIRRNTDIGGEISNNVMVIGGGGGGGGPGAGGDRPPPRPRGGNAQLQSLAVTSLSR